MGIVDRPVDDEPDEKPDQLGRHLLRIMRDYPGQWREVFETHNRQHAVRVEGCLIGRGAGRIAGVTDISNWTARLIERVEGEQTVYVVRVRYQEPGPNEKIAAAKEQMERLRQGHHLDEPEAGRVDPSKRKDPDEAAQLGLDAR